MATTELREIIVQDNSNQLAIFPNWYIAQYRDELHQLAEEKNSTNCLTVLVTIKQAQPLVLDAEPENHNPNASLSIAELDSAVAELSDEGFDEAIDFDAEEELYQYDIAIANA